MTTELKPCPFCGGKEIEPEEFGCFVFTCADCGTEGPAGDTEAEAAKLWNTRPDSGRIDALRECEKELKRELNIDARAPDDWTTGYIDASDKAISAITKLIEEGK